MTPFSVDDFQMILPKMTVLETKVHWIEVEEVNGLCRNNTTVPWSQNSSQEPANTWLISTNNDSMKQEDCALCNKSWNIFLCWNTLRAKPKDK